MRSVFLLCTIISLALGSCEHPSNEYSDPNWAHYQGGPSRNQFKTFDKINTGNVHRLEQVWEYSSNGGSETNGQIQCNPLIIDGILYGTSPGLKLFALNAATGAEQWTFDPVKLIDEQFGTGVNRGLSYWTDGKQARILYTVGPNLIAVDTKDGQPLSSFGENGVVNLKKGLGRNIDRTYYVNNTPGTIYRNLLIVGGRTSEGADHAPGHIRAFDVLTGKISWIFHTIPPPGSFGAETWPDSAYWKSGGANAWSGFSIDQEAGIVYAPTGSASFDFYGGDRHGQNLFANSIVALNANTGERIWHYQVRHHDLWDRDLPAPPNLIMLKKEGQQIKALAQITKSGDLFVLNRLTGKPIYPINEVPAEPSTLSGESAWPTQPVPTVYPHFSRTTFSEADIPIRSEQAKAEALSAWDSIRWGEFIPPALKTKVLFPGMDGGGEWGGAAFDPEDGWLFVNSNEMTWKFQFNKHKPLSLGQSIYRTNCQACHAANFSGNQLYGNIPDLRGVSKRMTKPEITTLLNQGRGIMPQFSKLTQLETQEVIKYVFGEATIVKDAGSWPYPYAFNGYEKFLTSDGLPIIRPPWGQLTAIDMNEAKIKWQVPLGNIDSLDIPGHPVTGTENYGGPVVTRGGLVFIAATSDEKMRAFDKTTGELLWEVKLPAAGYATPSTYQVNGKQYLVIACGGGKLGTASGDKYVAFAIN
ncbi:MAG: PQQ-binding-like beta-propeller repeat protein [Cytophagales bacterium]|nr:PQQ-binding-like beta-propeller repeat protein [Cytophagales bacterium]